MSRSPTRTKTGSAAISITAAVLVWPSFLLLASDVYGVSGWIKGCLVWREPVGAGLLSFLLCITVFFIAAWLRHIRRSARLKRSIRHLPLLEVHKTAWLHRALPGLKKVTLRVCELDEPQAFTVGWRSPTIMLSRWLLKNLDEQEIIAAVAHELAHVRYRDNLLMFWVQALCPGGFGLRPFRRQLRHLTMLIETRADAAGASFAGDPLALASALVKVRRASLLPRAVAVSSLAGDASLLRSRVAVLLGEGEPVRRFHRGSCVLLAAFALLTGFLVFRADTLPCNGTECELKGMGHPPPSANP